LFLVGVPPFLLDETIAHLIILGWRVYSQVLYFGDHLFSDVRAPAKAGWRTAAIIREFEVLITLIIIKLLSILGKKIVMLKMPL